MRRRKDPVSRIDSKRVKQDINLEQAFPCSTDSVVRQKYLKKYIINTVERGCRDRRELMASFSSLRGREEGKLLIFYEWKVVGLGKHKLEAGVIQTQVCPAAGPMF